MTSAVPVATLFFLSAAASALLSIRISRHASPTSRDLLGLAASATVWSIFYGLEILAETVFFRQFWSQCAYIGTFASSAFLLRFSVRWFRPKIRGWWLELLWVVPAALIVVVFTNGLHGLVWPEIRPSPSNPVIWYYGRGPLFWLGVSYGYINISLSVILIAAAAFTNRGIHRRQALYVFAGILVTVGGNVAYVTRFLKLPLDITPMAFAVSCAILFAGGSRGRMMDLLPAARHRVVDLMPDGLFVLDRDFRVVDWNTAALEMWSPDDLNPIGRPVGELLRGWEQDVKPALAGSGGRPLFIKLPGTGGDGQTELTVEIRAFATRSGPTEGWIVISRDETEIRRTENELQLANDRLEALNRMLLTQAIHDSLTGLFNRAYLDEVLPRELARCRRDGSAIALLILDVDFFKDVNDKHGHDAGDKVLREVADMVRRMVREGDIPCRFGGDEIVAVMPGTTRNEAAAVAERIREKVSEQQLEAGGADLTVTVSVGIAVFPDHADSAAELFRAADRALYAAKDAGRNRSIAASAAS